jgi:hypothetical protein
MQRQHGYTESPNLDKLVADSLHKLENSRNRIVDSGELSLVK